MSETRTTLIDLAVQRARMVISTLVLVLISGAYAYTAIPKEAAPDVNIPIIYVSMHYSGISPDDAERLLVRPMEKELRGIEGFREIRSTAYEGGANVLLEFEAGFDADRAMRDVRDRVDRAKAELPDGADEPTVNEINLSLFPVITVALSGAMPERALLRIARDLKDELESLPQVLSVDLAGDREEQVEVIIDPTVAESYGLSAGEVSGFISRSNTLIAAGAMDTGAGRFPVKVPGLLETVDDILTLPMQVSGDAVVTLRDIAGVNRGFKDPDGFARVNGEPALVLEVSKRIGENIIDTVAAVRETVDRESTLWPEELRVTFLQDQSEDIRARLVDLQNSVITAVLLVMVVVVGALGIRTGLLVGIAIPGSFLAAILALAAMGLTINMVVLFGLILAVGMLVDGAIVVTEFADRKMTEGLHRSEAYTLASRRMALPVIASTATTLAAFLPLAFWTGVVGEFMKYLPITLLCTLSASLLMALVFVPTVGALMGKPGAEDPETMKAIAASEHGSVTDLKGITGGYARLLDRALTRPGLVLLGALALLVTAQGGYWTYGKGVEFFPDVEPERALIYVHARGNLSVHEKDALVREVEDRLYGLEGVEAFYVRTGRSAEDQEQTEDVIGRIQMEFTDWRTRPKARDILAQARARTSDLAGIRIEVREEEAGPPVGRPIQVQLAARDPSLLPAGVEHVRRGMRELGGFADVQDTRPAPGIEWRLTVDRAQAAKFGIDVRAVGDVVQLVTNGLKFTDYRPDDSDEEVDIVARYPVAYRTLDQLDALRLSTENGPVPLSGFVTREARPRTGELQRVDGVRVLTVKADPADGLLADDQVRALRAWLADNPVAPGIEVAFRGEDEEQRKSRAFLGRAFLVALFLMAIILVTQFNSFYSAFLILSAVVMSTIGVMLGLLATGQPFGIIMSGIGVIALAGIVVNNNIVLIDTHDRLRKSFTDAREAILRTGVQRLRPVLLTTVTTALGLMPMMFSVNIDFVARDITVGAPSMQWWAQLSTAVVCGLLFATVLTLVVTPCALMVRANVEAWLARRKQAAHTAAQGTM